MNGRSLADLASPDPRARFQTFRTFQNRYEPEVGDALVAAFLREDARGVWWYASLCVLPIWLPKLDLALRALPEWPFTAARTLRVLDLAHRHPLPSAAPYADDWLDRPEWAWRFAAFRWLANGDDRERVCRAARRLADDLDGFAVDEAAREGYFWMDEFADRAAREREIREFLSEVCVEELPD